MHNFLQKHHKAKEQKNVFHSKKQNNLKIIPEDTDFGFIRQTLQNICLKYAQKAKRKWTNKVNQECNKEGTNKEIGRIIKEPNRAENIIEMRIFNSGFKSGVKLAE